MQSAAPDVRRLREAQDSDAIRAIPSWEFERPPPDREWMVEGAFPKGTVCMVSGDGGIGKSLLMQQLLSSACLGREWLGMRCTPGRGLLFACEDDADELLRRQASIGRHIGCAWADFENGVHLVARVGQENTLGALERKEWRLRATNLAYRLMEYCTRHGISYLVIDTATQTFAGNQNDERQVVDFINILRRIAVAIQGVVILTKHPSLSGRANGSGESGNTAWNNSVRSRLYVQQTKAGTVLRGMKANYSAKLKELPIRWERGVFVLDQPEPADRWYDR